MAAKMMLSSPHPLPLRSLPFHTNKLQPWHQQHLPTPKPKKLLRLSLHESAEFITQQQQQLLNPNSLLLLTTTETSGYSLASYYTSLGLFVISVPGLWSLIKRSVKSKVSNSFTLCLIITIITIFVTILVCCGKIDCEEDIYRGK
jgi:hypothetical protein